MATSIVIIGCRYHTTWQRNKSMSWILREVNGNRVRLSSNKQPKGFWTDIESLIWIQSDNNDRRLKEYYEKASS